MSNFREWADETLEDLSKTPCVVAAGSRAVGVPKLWFPVKKQQEPRATEVRRVRCRRLEAGPSLQKVGGGAVVKFKHPNKLTVTMSVTVTVTVLLLFF